MIENVHSVCINTAYVCAAGVGAVAVAYGAARGMKFLSGGVKCVTAVSLVGSLIFGGMVVTSVHVAGAKTNDTQQVGGDLSNTNDVGQVEGGTNVLMGVQGRARSPSATQGEANGESNGQALRRVRRTRPTGMVSITDDDIVQGWRVVLVSSNALEASTFTMPPHATVWENARDFGAGWGSWKIPLDGWRFSFGDEGMTNAFVWVEGYFRSRFNSRTNEITLLNERMAFCPAANWSRYNLPASRAWCQTNGVGGLVTTFENAAVGDDPTKIVSAQMELSPQDGTVSLRYNLRSVGESLYEAGITANGTNHFVTVGSNTSEVVFQRVHPDDWDFDGLPNALDPSPRQPDAGAGFNQSDTWAMLAFPSNAAEIASMGYAAWAAARAADPNRRLIAFTLASKNNTWPVCLTFGDVQVMCDGAEQIVFPIDCGARYAFSVSGGELATVSVPGVETRDATWEEWFDPWDYTVDDVTVHQESPSSGWICRTAEVEIGNLEFAHFFSGDERTVTAVVTNCHSDAYVGCTWSGGEGVTFSDSHSLSTTIIWSSADSIDWNTNCVSLITCYAGGYALTNTCLCSVGSQEEPSIALAVSCPPDQFLNDDGRRERFYPVTVLLCAPPGVRGKVVVETGGGAVSYLSLDAAGRMNCDGVPLDLAMSDESPWHSSLTLYMFSPVVGIGEVNANFFVDAEPDSDDDGSDPADGGTGQTDDETGDDVTKVEAYGATARFRVFEPLRKLVTSEMDLSGTRYVNPSRLVAGRSSVLKVDVNGPFDLADVDWQVTKGTAIVVPQENGYATVTPIGSSKTVTVEARFNCDAIQPQFVLPVVEERVINVKAFVVTSFNGRPVVQRKDVEQHILASNRIFQQVGIRFDLASVTILPESSRYFEITPYETVRSWFFWSEQRISSKVVDLLNTYQNMDGYQEPDCIELYFVGQINGPGGLWLPGGIIVGRTANCYTIAHELGHALGLADCYLAKKNDEFDPRSDSITLHNTLAQVDGSKFESHPRDWGDETGRGFYAVSDRVTWVYPRLLMHGSEDPFVEDMADLPDGKVWCVQGNARRALGIGFTPVGAANIKPTNAEVYTK